MDSSELPSRLIEQVTEMGDSAFSKDSRHLLTSGRAEKEKKSRVSHVFIVVCVPCLLTRRSIAYATEAARPMSRSSGWGGTGSSAPGVSSQVRRRRTTSPVCPIVEHSANEEGGYSLRVIIIMPRRLRVKEVVAFFENPNMSARASPSTVEV
jgi:hypothetical protein